MKAFDILSCTVFLSDDKACWSNRDSLSSCWNSSLPSSHCQPSLLPNHSDPHSGYLTTFRDQSVVILWLVWWAALPNPCPPGKALIPAGSIALLSAIPPCLSEAQPGVGHHLMKVGRVLLLWVVFTFHVLKYSILSPPKTSAENGLLQYMFLLHEISI